ENSHKEYSCIEPLIRRELRQKIEKFAIHIVKVCITTLLADNYPANIVAIIEIKSLSLHGY
ncbi:MAG: hypothetical protein IKK35_07850, partial [Rikenellaceae bacterium]|nr:hypothetical protein [Rikenellaceae bacterium]